MLWPHEKQLFYGDTNDLNPSQKMLQTSPKEHLEEKYICSQMSGHKSTKLLNI